MSIATNPKLYAFHRWLRTHCVTGKPEVRFNQEVLAELVMTNRAHLSQVLNGTRKGTHTWKRLVKVLPTEGLSLLRQSSAWNKVAEAAYRERKAEEAIKL